MNDDLGDRVHAGKAYEASGWHESPVPDPGPGQHLWVVVAVWQVARSGDAEMFLDEENLLSVRGPRCLKCGLIPEAASDECLADAMGTGLPTDL